MKAPLECPYCGCSEKQYYDGKRTGKYKTWIFAQHLAQVHKKSIYQFLKEQGLMFRCKCGCSEQIKEFYLESVFEPHSYIKGHKKAWNSGLTKKNDKRLLRLSKQRTGSKNPRYGRPAWNSGLTTETSAILKKMGEKTKGRKRSAEICRKMRKNAYRRWGRGDVFGMVGRKHTKRTRRKLRRKTIANYVSGKHKFSSSIENMFEKLCIQDRIKYTRQYRYGRYVFDFKIRYKGKEFLIEVNGVYWHGFPKFWKKYNKTQIHNVKRDIRKTNFVVRMKRYMLVVVWEHEFSSLERVRKCLTKRIQKLLKSKVSNQLVSGGCMTSRCKILNHVLS